MVGGVTLPPYPQFFLIGSRRFRKITFVGSGGGRSPPQSPVAPPLVICEFKSLLCHSQFKTINWPNHATSDTESQKKIKTKLSDNVSFFLTLTWLREELKLPIVVPLLEVWFYQPWLNNSSFKNVWTEFESNDLGKWSVLNEHICSNWL